MAWVNASGQAVSVQPATIQLDLPAEAVGDQAGTISAVNWVKVIVAVVQLGMALSSGNAVAIATAIQNLINAITGG